MKSILLALALLLSACTPGQEQAFQRSAAKIGQGGSLYFVARGIQDHVSTYPGSKAPILKVAAILQSGTLTGKEVTNYVNDYLSRAKVPALERQLISDALWGEELGDLKLDGEIAGYIATVGRYAELGALAATSGNK